MNNLKRKTFSKKIDTESNDEVEKSVKKNGAKSLVKSDTEESDEEIKTKKTDRKPRTPRAKKALINEDIESKNDLVIKDMSSINPISDDEFKSNPKASKKARGFLQSTAIDTNLYQEKFRTEDAPKSPKVKMADCDTPVNTPRVAKNSRLHKQPSFDESNNENKQFNGHHLIMDSPKPSTNKLTGGHSAAMNKIKSCLQEPQAPRSPLALVNINNKESGFMLVKKRKNVLKCDAWTQTDQSYLSAQKNNF
ncbi:hypothetical protein BpHYR1_011927 [Brachionus plicatilis]|uniref:Uncharacterized protein n=1 Tax=Brachionus plicatilis TaxID=10195 RepID=A0A3M7P5Q2_BRAPC|nr:hypothetical protein BpHYR1_011927 [Brachionus plicatilis]